MGRNLGFRVLKNPDRPSEKLLARYKNFQVAVVGDALGRFQVMDYRIKSINKPGVHMAGSAVTVRVRPGDNLMVHKALQMAGKGDIIAVDAQESCLNGLWGEITTEIAIKKELSGLVMDGAVRDAIEIRRSGFPVFTRAVSAAGGDKDGPGEVNIPINCGGVPVNPGDIIVGDDDGVVVVPITDAEYAADKIEELIDKEAETIQKIRKGETDRPWVDERIIDRGGRLL